MLPERIPLKLPGKTGVVVAATMVPLVPVVFATVSLAVSVWFPAVLKVAVNLPTPLTSVPFNGKTAVLSLDAK